MQEYFMFCRPLNGIVGPLDLASNKVFVFEVYNCSYNALNNY